MNERVAQSGVYCITHIASGKRYIGSSKDIERRWIGHKVRLDAGNHHSPYLLNAWRKYGAEAFTLSILELVTDLVLLLEREQYYLDQRFVLKGSLEYNVSPTASSRLGTKTPRSPAQEAYWERMRGQTPDERSTAMLAAGRAKYLSLSSEERSELHREGWKKSPNRRSPAKLRALAEINAQPKSATQRRKISASLMNKTQSPETIAKRMQTFQELGIPQQIAEKLRGRTRPESAKEKQRQAMTGRTMSHKGKPWSAKRRAAQEKRKQQST